MGKSKLIINKFYNETFEFKFEFIIYDYSNQSQLKKVHKRLLKTGLGATEATKLVQSSMGFVHGSKRILLGIDINEFDLSKEEDVIELFVTIKHECNHVLGHTLTTICETITKTDTEVYQRISDWAFKKCLGTKFIKKLLNKRK